VSRLLLVCVEEGLAAVIESLEGHRATRLGSDQLGDLAVTLAMPDAPDVLVLGEELPLESSLNFSASVVEHHPEVEVVLVREADGDLPLRALRAGVRDIVPPSADEETLRETFARPNRWPRREPADAVVVPAVPEAVQDGRVIVVTSPKGGVGKTTVATNLALAFGLTSPGDVVLVDLDLQFGDVDTLLNVQPSHTIADVFDGSGAFDALVMRTFLTVHESGVSVLCGAPAPDVADRISGRDVGELIDELSRQFRHVVVDTSAGITEWTLAALEQASNLVLLSSMDVACIRGMRKEIDVLAELGLMPQARTVVLNMADRQSGMKVKDVEAVIGVPVDCVLPRAREVHLAGNHGAPMVLSRRKSAFSKGIRSLSEAIQAQPHVRRHRRVELA
jgi:pilus assembly protein CpaE